MISNDFELHFEYNYWQRCLCLECTRSAVTVSTYPSHCNWAINILHTGLIYLTNIFGCIPLQWRHNGRDSVSNHQPCECLLSRLIRRRSKKTSKIRVTGLCAWNSPETGEFPSQRAKNAENVSIRWRHHAIGQFPVTEYQLILLFH